MRKHSKLARNTKSYSKSYAKLRQYAIRDDIRSEKEGRAFLDTCDALELVILDLSTRVLALEKQAAKNQK